MSGGRIAARGDLHASVTAFNQAGGELSSEGALMLEADSLDNRSGGLVSADGNLTVSARRIDNRAGEIASPGQVTLDVAEQLDNRGGKAIGDSDFASPRHGYSTRTAGYSPVVMGCA